MKRRDRSCGWCQARVPAGCGSGGLGRRDLKAPVVPWSGEAVRETFPVSLGARVGISFDPGLWWQACFPLPQTPRSCGPPSSCVCPPPPPRGRVFWGVCACACMCLQASTARGLLWGWESSWLPACGQPWEEPSLLVWPWFGDVQYFDRLSVIVGEGSLRKVFGLLLWDYLYKVVGYIFRNCVY